MTYQNITLLGNVGKTATLQYTQQGRAICSWSLAVNRTWKNERGEKQQETTWYDCSLWGEKAEKLHAYIEKGMQLLVVSDRIEARAFTRNDGTVGASLQLTVKDVTFVGGRGERQEQSQYQDEPQDIPF